MQACPKVFAKRGVKQVGAMTSGERGINVTMISAVNAIGNSIPSMFIFPRVKYIQMKMMRGAPPGSIGAANPSGWSNERTFSEFLDHFIAHAHPSKDNQVVLLMDNRASHISIDAIGKAKENGIHLVTFHPHTTHKIQPLDRTVFSPFKTNYNNAVTNFMISSENAGKPITIYHIAELAGMAYTKAFTPSSIINGFKVCGLYPLNPDIFSEEDFLPSSVTDRPLRSEDSNPPTSSQGSLLSTPPKSGCTNLKSVSPFDIMPLPKAGPRTNNKPSRKGKACIVTDTPEKKEIEEKKENNL